jgi:penicillin V acylase-like amidase (Ntn superfamily)
MKRRTIRTWLLACVVTLVVSDSDACLTFCLQDGTNCVYGRNFDWAVDVGVVIINQRHIRKTAFVLPPEKPLSWVSQYGSVTFNQFSRDIPVGGMNEEGLVIESLVSTAEHPSADKRSAINELQWIQYHLDTCKTVADVIRSASAVRISKYAVSLHYFVSDPSGNSAVIEFIQGKMVHRTADRLPVKVLANTSYAHALETLPSQKGRFARATQMINHHDSKKTASEYAFAVLDSVAQGAFTKWQVVYDISRRQIHFRTLRNRKIRMISMEDCDFKHASEPLAYDVNGKGEGLVNKLFKTHTEDLNNALMQSSLQELKTAGLMQHVTPDHIKYIRNVIASCKYEPLSNADKELKASDKSAP